MSLSEKETKKIILHLCADIGSDSRYYQLNKGYEVILVGKEIGVENFSAIGMNVHGVIANPVCTEFSRFHNFANGKEANPEDGLSLVRHCQRIIKESNPKWWVIENPASGTLNDYLGKPYATYEPYQYGSGWTKRTALWGKFNMPEPLFTWETCPKNDNLYIRPGRSKPSLAFLHKSALQFMPEYEWAKDKIKTDSDLRSMCSDGFAREFYKSNQ